MDKNNVLKRGKHSGQSTKRTKRISEIVEHLNVKKFVKACKQLSQNAYYNYNKRLKLLSLPKCNTCIQSSAEPTAMSQLVENFQSEIKLNMWYEALETCYYSITPTQYLPENVLMGIVGIILNGHENSSTKYSMAQIINKCQQILSYHFNMHPPCSSHPKIINCYKKLLTEHVIVQTQKYTKRDDFGYTAGIIKYCFNRLEYEIHAGSIDGPLYSKDQIDFEYKKIFKEGNTNSLTVKSIHRLGWEQQNYEIFEMLNRTERINRLMAILYSMIELIQFDMYNAIRNVKMQGSFLHNMVFEKDRLSNLESKLGKQIMEIFAYLIHLDYPDDHIKTMSLWLNAMFEMMYFKNDIYQVDFPSSLPLLTNFQTEFNNIIKKLPPQSMLKILERIEPPYMKYYLSRYYVHENLDCEYTNVIKIIYDFINNSDWSNYPDTNEHYIPNEIKKDIESNDILKHLSQICRNVNLKYNKVDKENVYEKFDKNQLYEDEMTQNDIIKLLYISLQAMLDVFNVQKAHNAIQENAQEEMIAPVVLYNVTNQREREYESIYNTQKELIELIQQKEAEGKLPKFLECFKIIYT